MGFTYNTMIPVKPITVKLSSYENVCKALETTKPKKRGVTGRTQISNATPFSKSQTSSERLLHSNFMQIQQMEMLGVDLFGFSQRTLTHPLEDTNYSICDEPERRESYFTIINSYHAEFLYIVVPWRCHKITNFSFISNLII